MDEGLSIFLAKSWLIGEEKINHVNQKRSSVNFTLPSGKLWSLSIWQELKM
jgi:hypothetical protein